MPYTGSVEQQWKAFKILFWTCLVGWASYFGYLAFTVRFHEMKLGWRIIMTLVVLFPTGLVVTIPLAIVILMVVSFSNIIYVNYQWAKRDRERRKADKAQTQQP